MNSPWQGGDGERDGDITLDVERWVRQAGRLPVLSDDRRPCVIEAAAEGRVQLARRRCFRTATLVMSMWLVMSSAGRIADGPIASRELRSIFEMRKMRLDGNQDFSPADAAQPLRYRQLQILRAAF